MQSHNLIKNWIWYAEIMVISFQNSKFILKVCTYALVIFNQRIFSCLYLAYLVFLMWFSTWNQFPEKNFSISCWYYEFCHNFLNWFKMISSACTQGRVNPETWYINRRYTLWNKEEIKNFHDLVFYGFHLSQETLLEK